MILPSKCYNIDGVKTNLKAGAPKYICFVEYLDTV